MRTAAAGPWLAQGLRGDASASRPNVLFVISDDLNNDFGGVLHLADTHVPHLDRLSRQGVRFERAFCQYPLCNPSRVSLLSGLYPTTTQVLDNITPPRYALTDYVTLPQYLRQHGYNTAYVGKVFHLLDPISWQKDAPPPVRVKDHKFNYWMEPVRPENRKVADMLRSFMQPQTGAAETLEDYRIATEAIRLMNGFHEAKEPFFLAVGFRRPHVPFIAPDSAYRMYSPAKVSLPEDFAATPSWKGVPLDAFRPNLDLFFERDATPEKAREMIAAYYGCVSFVDMQLGRLLAELDRLAIANTTIVSVVADHGWHLGQKGMWAKMTLFENSARVPLILYDPRSKSPGGRCQAIAESLDLYPTLVDLCGLPVPQNLHGRSLARFLENPRETWDRPALTVMLRHGLLGKSIRTPRWRYTEWDDGSRGAELYDHEHDPYELKNLIAEARYAVETAELKKQLNARLAHAPVP
ncbi:MAG TPA: sulfatase [Bryobacteraceae bacterium]|nr:sulfatase [Bryobacteraceae bacterium]